jgi:hypothetical protein
MAHALCAPSLTDFNFSPIRIVRTVHTIKPVLRGHLWDKEKWPYKTDDLLKEVQFI